MGALGSVLDSVSLPQALLNIRVQPQAALVHPARSPWESGCQLGQPEHTALLPKSTSPCEGDLGGEMSDAAWASFQTTPDLPVGTHFVVIESEAEPHPQWVQL